MSLQTVESPSWLISLLSLCAWGLVAACLFLWVRTAKRWPEGKSILPPVEARSKNSWGLVDFLFGMSAFVAIQIAAFGIGRYFEIGSMDLTTKEPDLRLMGWISLFCLFTVPATTAWMMLRGELSFDEIGWSVKRLGQDCVLGLKAFAMIVPPIVILMNIVTKWSGVKYEHPVISAAQEDSSLLFPAFLMAVISAPLLEEFGFRVLLQGFLEGLGRDRFSLDRLFFGTRRSEAVVHNEETRSAGRTVESPIPLWPSVVTAVLFGLAHYSYGLSWLPLIFFGFGLGLLYRSTGRIWPCLVVHACFNALTIGMLALNILYEIPIAN
jgi:membrane protease YdiL (CAAX protease family)